MKTISKVKALIFPMTIGFIISFSSCMTRPAATTVVIAPRVRPVVVRRPAVVVVKPGRVYRPYRHCGRRW